MTEEPKLTMAIVARAGYCPAGVRRWTREQGIDLRQLVYGGIPVSELEGNPDPRLQKLLTDLKTGRV